MKRMRILSISAFPIFLCGCYMIPTRDNRPIASLEPEQARVCRAVLAGVLGDMKKEFNVSAWSAFYIELPGKTDPPSEWLDEYAGYPTPLMPASKCVMEGTFNEVINRKTGKSNGLIVYIGEGVVQHDQTITADYCWHDSSLSGGCANIRLKQVGDKWVVIEKKITLMS